MTTDERAEFEALSRQLQSARSATAVAAQVSQWFRRLGTLPAGVLLAIAGGVWCIAWLGTNVLVSFGGVITQAVGVGLVIEYLRLRTERAGSAEPPEASQQRTSAQRRRGL